MFAKSIRILFVVLSLSLVTAGVAFAESGVPEGGVRYAGLITDLDLPGKAFLLRTPHSGEIRVHVTGATTFRSPGGEVESFDDLEEGMRIAVAGPRAQSPMSFLAGASSSFRHAKVRRSPSRWMSARASKAGMALFNPSMT